MWKGIWVFRGAHVALNLHIYPLPISVSQKAIDKKEEPNYSVAINFYVSPSEGENREVTLKDRHDLFTQKGAGSIWKIASGEDFLPEEMMMGK
jgi:hypothetical protein